MLGKLSTRCARFLGCGDQVRPFVRCNTAVALAVGLFSLCIAYPLRAEYRVDAGDVIEIFVSQVPELQRRVAVKIDGNVSFPMLGTIQAAGLTPAQLQEKIQTVLTTKVYQQRTSDGREIDIVIAPYDVTATVVEYRPVYVSGDVAKPGEYVYRPFMTARQAIAASGGYNVVPAGATNPYLESVDLRSEYDMLWTELAKEQARIWRVKSELGDKDNIDKSHLIEVPVAHGTVTKIVDIESEHLKASKAFHDGQRDFLKTSIKKGAEQIGVLTEQRGKEEQGEQADTDELQKVIMLFEKGNMTSPRVMDARRAVLLSATRKLQTVSQLMQVERQQEELSRQIENVDSLRKMELLKELQDANGKASAVRRRLQGISEKLQYLATRSSSGGGDKIGHDIVIFRKCEKGRERLVAGDDFELQPGDVVEVAAQGDKRSEGAFPNTSQ